MNNLGQRHLLRRPKRNLTLRGFDRGAYSVDIGREIPLASTMTSPVSPSRAGAGAASSSTSLSAADPVLRNALRYTISAREYALLHRYIISRSRVLKKRAPTVDTVQRIMNGRPHDRRKEQRAPGDQAKGKTEGSVGEADGSEKPAAAQGGKDAAVGGADDYNARAIRHSLRVFVATGVAMKLWEVISSRFLRKPNA